MVAKRSHHSAIHRVTHRITYLRFDSVCLETERVIGNVGGEDLAGVASLHKVDEGDVVVGPIDQLDQYSKNLEEVG